MIWQSPRNCPCLLPCVVPFACFLLSYPLFFFHRAGGVLAPWHLCLTSGEQKMEAVCAASSHLRLILFLLLPVKVLEQNKTALCGVSVDIRTLKEECLRSTAVLVVQNHKSQESGEHTSACALLHCSFLVGWRHQGQVSEPLKDWHRRLVRGKRRPFPHPSLLKLCLSLSMTFDSIMMDSNSYLLFLEHDAECISMAAFCLNLSVPLGTHSFEFPKIPRQECLTSDDNHCRFRFEKIFGFLELLLEEDLFI